MEAFFAFSVVAPATALVARSLFTGREGARLASIGKGGSGLQPGIPGRRLHQERLLLLILLIGQRVPSYDGCHPRHGSSPTTWQVERFSFPSRKADVR